MMKTARELRELADNSNSPNTEEQLKVLEYWTKVVASNGGTQTMLPDDLTPEAREILLIRGFWIEDTGLIPVLHWDVKPGPPPPEPKVNGRHVFFGALALAIIIPGIATLGDYLFAPWRPISWGFISGLSALVFLASCAALSDLLPKK